MQAERADVNSAGVLAGAGAAGCAGRGRERGRPGKTAYRFPAACKVARGAADQSGAVDGDRDRVPVAVAFAVG